jgi:hypothetical protein
LFQRGYYQSSLDTLKRYNYRKGVVPSFDKIYVFKYFEPLKHGTWEEFKAGKCIKRRVFDMGVELMSSRCEAF